VTRPVEKFAGNLWCLFGFLLRVDNAQPVKHDVGYQLSFTREEPFSGARMTMKLIYGLLTILGLAAAGALLMPFFARNGPDFEMAGKQVLNSYVSVFFLASTLICTLGFWALVYQETGKRRIPYWGLAVFGGLILGPSFGLPFFLLLREIRVAKEKARK